MKAAITAQEAAALIPDGASIMYGGFMAVGTPNRIFDALVARGAKELTIIGNDTASPGVGVGKLIDAGCVRCVKASHIGTNPVTQKKMIAGEIDVELIPQGTLAERIRAGGAGLGGILTQTGVGTMGVDKCPYQHVMMVKTIYSKNRYALILRFCQREKPIILEI